jgi:hypothetical protein
MVDFETVRELALALPGVEEGTSYGTPAFRVRRKLLVRLREDGDLVVMVPFEERELLVEARPETFHVTDHYRDYPAVLVRLPKVKKGELRELVTRAWRDAAPRRLVAEYEAKGG